MTYSINNPTIEPAATNVAKAIAPLGYFVYFQRYDNYQH
jgi:hypothetical protein